MVVVSLCFRGHGDPFYKDLFVVNDEVVDNELKKLNYEKNKVSDFVKNGAWKDQQENYIVACYETISNAKLAKSALEYISSNLL